MSQNKDKLNKLAKQVFKVYDHEGTNTIKIENTEIVIQSMGLNPTKNDVTKYKSQLDPNNTGFFDLKALMSVIQNNNTEINLVEQAKEAFYVLDADGSGGISSVELKHVLSNLGERLDPKELDIAFANADNDGDGELSFNEFLKFVSQK